MTSYTLVFIGSGNGFLPVFVIFFPLIAPQGTHLLIEINSD